MSSEKPELTAGEVADIIKSKVQLANVVVHVYDDGLVTVTPQIRNWVSPAARQQNQSEVDALLHKLQQEYHIVKKRTVDFGRQASLNGRPFETLAHAIALKDPRDVGAIISFDHDTVTGQPAPNDLLHDEIERLRASPELKDYLATAR